MIIGLTGRIGTGKNVVAEMFSEHKYSIIDVDKVGHEILTEIDIKEKLIDAFGINILANGRISRKLLSELVFTDEQNLNELNAIMHPRMKEIIKAKVKLEGNFVINAAVLFEMGLNELCDYIINVDSEDALIIKRMKSRGLGEVEVMDRLSSQMSKQKYNDLANYIIHNNKDAQFLKEQVASLLENQLV